MELQLALEHKLLEFGGELAAIHLEPSSARPPPKTLTPPMRLPTIGSALVPKFMTLPS